MEETVSSPAAAVAPAAPVVTAESTPAPQPTSQTEDTSAAPAPGAETPKPKREGGFQKRIKELTQEKYELRRHNERLLALVEERHKPKDSTAAPKIDDYQTLDEFLEARDAWKEQKRSVEAKTAKTIDKHESPDPGFAAARDVLYDEGSEKYPDFADVVGNQDVRITPDMAAYVMDSDQSVDLAYHLGKNPAVAAKIANMPPLRQIAALARLEDNLNKPARPSAAPAPVTPVAGSIAATGEPDSSKDYAAWLKWRRSQVHGARK